MIDYVVVYKVGNTIKDTVWQARDAQEALSKHARFEDRMSGVLAVMPQEVYALLPDASVFLGVVTF